MKAADNWSKTQFANNMVTYDYFYYNRGVTAECRTVEAMDPVNKASSFIPFKNAQLRLCYNKIRRRLGWCPMNKADKYAYWLDAAEYDFGTASSMFDAGRYSYVAFMCQQALEKLVKGLFGLHVGDSIPRVHNISFIFAQVASALDIEVPEQTMGFFDELSAFYLQGRYPTYKEKISQMVDHSEAQRILKSTEEVYAWLKSLPV